MEPQDIDINIREKAKDFFINKVILNTPNMNGGKDQECSILILDKKTTKIIDSFMTMTDTVDGRIIGMFSLEKKRK